MKSQLKKNYLTKLNIKHQMHQPWCCHGRCLCPFSRVTVKRAYIQVMIRIKKKMYNVLFKKIIFFLGIENYPSFLKQRLLNNKIPGSSATADSPFAGSIHPKCDPRQVLLISLHLQNDAAKIYFSHYSQYTFSPANILNIPLDYRFSFCLANSI